MTQKFIDRDGLKALWNQVNLKDYPNNKTLMAVIDAIDETKADKTDIVQSDWNQNDETASDYVKNRPFYTTDPQPVELCNGTFEFNNSSDIVDNPSAFYESSAISYDESELVVNKEITIAYDGTTYNNLIFTEAIVEYNGQTMPFGLYAGNGAILAEYLTTMLSGVTVSLEDTGEPFVLSLMHGSSSIITKDNASTHDISISVVKPVDITISQKYLGFPVWAGEGKNSIIIGDENGVASGEYTVCEGTGNKAIGACSHAEGYSNEATGNYSHAEGCFNEATGNYSHAEGRNTKATGNYSHAEGQATKAIGNYSHVEGWGSEASGDYSHAEGYHNIVSGRYQHVQGKYNIEDAEDKYAHIVGNGTHNTERSNAHTLDWDGNANYAGDVYVGNANENKAGKKLATEEYVDSQIPTDDDALALSIEMGLIEPIENNGYVLTDANGVIYTI